MQEYDEFFAAEAADEVDRSAARFAYAVCDALETFVTDLMPVRVVELFEEVDVDDEERDFGAPSLLKEKREASVGVEGLAVGEAGQSIDGRERP